ncbi:conserved exported hypothetical protein [Pseudomonas sp. 8Z]|uniref:hypothetical protein n=1 Tax=Pseudomonas sp. 8Z TaxID=2653166 RepID=UPI0012F3F114|nr:hypothetical protein [Pseudomonas sp. 8Z]VXC34445.1 conserved exported hypothetical protein [Pseudomonas sp. 8Z]
MKRLVLLCVLGFGLTGCAVQPGAPLNDLPPVQQPSHPRYAPPPAVKSHWSPALGVYVVEGRSDLFYRERVFYRFDGGWSWSTQPGGPWQATDSSGIPPGLFRHYQNR